jgi:SAM-dependent methyltransferase
MYDAFVKRARAACRGRSVGLGAARSVALAGAVLVTLTLSAPAQAQELFSPFVPSEMDDVKRMLKIANLRDNDVVYDLGSGDGRIVLEAARINKTVRGRGIEIDEKLVAKSNAAAKENGFDDRVSFLHQNVFDADLREATVITMWLFPELMRLLRPKIMAEARPGTRVVTRTWDLAGWTADRKDDSFSPVYLWVVPAKVGGHWTWDLTIGKEKRTYHAVIDQWFQKAEGVARTGNRRGILDDLRLEGDRISFVLNVRVDGVGVTRHQLEGRVAGDAIEGTVKLLHEPNQEPYAVPWRARRAGNPSGYFAPTGVDIR